MIEIDDDKYPMDRSTTMKLVEESSVRSGWWVGARGGDIIDLSRNHVTRQWHLRSFPPRIAPANQSESRRPRVPKDQSVLQLPCILIGWGNLMQLVIEKEQMCCSLMPTFPLLPVRSAFCVPFYFSCLMYVECWDCGCPPSKIESHHLLC